MGREGGGGRGRGGNGAGRRRDRRPAARAVLLSSDFLKGPLRGWAATRHAAPITDVRVSRSCNRGEREDNGDDRLSRSQDEKHRQTCQAQCAGSHALSTSQAVHQLSTLGLGLL